MITSQFTLYMENRPGEIARVTGILARARINIEGISVAESTDVGLVQVVTSHPVETRRLLKKAGIPFTVQDVVRTSLSNRPGALFELVSRLAEDRVNVNYVYATATEGDAGGRPFVIIGADDLKAVEAVLAGRARRKPRRR